MMNPMVVYNADKYRSIETAKGIDLGEAQICEVRLRHSLLLGTKTSVSSTVLLAGLVIGGIHASDRGFDTCMKDNVVAEWKLLQSRPAKTTLGMRLMQIRERIVKSGVPLLGWDEVEKEVAERRGETV